MTHIDKNSLKHLSVCFLLSLIGAYGMSVAIGASVTREYDNSKRPKAIIGVGGIFYSTYSVVQEEWLCIGGFSRSGTFNN